MERHPAVKFVNQSFVESFNKFRPPRSIGMRLLGDCMLKTILDFRATEADFVPADGRGRDNMSYGSAYEVWMGERLKGADLLKFGGILWKDSQINVRAYEGNGYMDFWCFYENTDIAVEVKTKDARGWDQIIKSRTPDKAHVYQLMAYMHFLKFKRGWLIYIDREKHFEAQNGEYIPRWEIFEIDYDEELGQKLERRLIKLSEYKKDGTTPKKEPKVKTDPRCRYCSHSIKCWGESQNNRGPRRTAISTRLATASTARRRALFKASSDD